MTVRIKRAYEPAEASDGYRVLVDRIWPRGVSKERADVAIWLKEVGPSTALRKWFGHVPERFPEFEQRYRAELSGGGAESAAFEHLKQLVAEHPIVTLVYSAKDEQHNQAVVLQKLLTKG